MARTGGNQIGPGRDFPEYRRVEGPVLGIGIDGVCIPRNGAFDMRPPGFHCRPETARGLGPRWHPRLGSWLDKLDNAFPLVLWISSWGKDSTSMGASAGSRAAARWYWKMKPTFGYERSWYNTVPPDIPLALIDDHLGGDRLVPLIRARSASTLVIAPNPRIGLGQALVDLLCEFAADPERPEFRAQHAWRFYSDPELAWKKPTADPYPWPTPDGHLRPDIPA